LQIDGPGPLGILAYKVASIQQDNEMVDAIQICIPIQDIRDATDDPYVHSAILMPDGESIMLTCPSVPRYMLTNLRELWKTTSNVCEPTILAHQVIATAIGENEAKRMKRIQLHFPANIRAKNEHFGFRSAGVENINIEVLNTNYNTGVNGVDGKEVKFSYTWLSMKVTIDEEARFLAKKVTQVDKLGDVLKRMNLTK
jgi:hypothetical protein